MLRNDRRIMNLLAELNEELFMRSSRSAADEKVYLQARKLQDACSEVLFSGLAP